LVEIVEMIERIGIVIPKEMQPAFLKTTTKSSSIKKIEGENFPKIVK
jgi:hypothetical protein